jgi:hypothetical protein
MVYKQNFTVIISSIQLNHSKHHEVTHQLRNELFLTVLHRVNFENN